MKSTIALGCLALLLCQAISSLAFAAETRVALVVGASTYQHAPHLANTLNDAGAVAEKLTELGFDVETVTDPDRQKFEESVRRLGQRARGTDAALFYYSGHALEHDGHNWLIPVQANLQTERDLRFEALDLDAVVEQIEGQAKFSMMVLDTCRDNPFQRRFSGPDSRGVAVGRGIAPLQTATGTLVVYATAPGEVAADGMGQHSPFTAALLRHIDTPGSEVRQMIAEVRHDVRQATYGQQIPWESSAMEGLFFMNPAPALTDGYAEQAFWDSIKDTADSLDLTLYLNRSLASG